MLQVGIKHIRDGVERLPVIPAEMSVIGIVGTAPSADVSVFPVDTPVYVQSDDAETLAKLGAGSIMDAIVGIQAQLLSGGAKLVIVRVAAGVDTDATCVAVAGNSTNKTGMWALVNAPQALGVTPRILLASGWTAHQNTGVKTLTIGTAGTGYTVGAAITATGGGGTGFTGEVSSIGAGGSITGVRIISGGKGYTSNPTFAVAGGTGGAITGVIGKLANVVCAALPALCSRLFAHAVVQGPTSSRQVWIDWRETLQSSRLIPGSCNDVVILNDAGSSVTKPADAYIAGLIVRRDQEFDGRPFRSAANQPIYGIVGVSRQIEFSLVDETVEAQDLFGRNGGVIVRGESGVESALAEGGFVYFGTDTLSEDPLWRFYNVTRGRDYIELAQLRTLRFYLGRYNITLATIDAILNTLGDQLSFEAAQGNIIGYRLGFEPGKNPATQLRQGNLWIKFQAEEPPVLRKITISSQRYARALDDLVVTISNQLDALEV
jgi:phage tail sheath protein FI